MTDQQTTEQELTGYARPLFGAKKERYYDDRMMGGNIGDKMDIRYHDKEKALKIVNGLCWDIFFRAEDIDQPWYEEVPDFSAPVPPSEPKKMGPVDYRKPLDSRSKKRMPLLEPTEPEKPSKPSHGGHGRGKPDRNSRHRKNRNRRRRRR